MFPRLQSMNKLLLRFIGPPGLFSFVVVIVANNFVCSMLLYALFYKRRVNSNASIKLIINRNADMLV